MKARSVKMQRLYVQRRELVKRMLLAHPVCQRCQANRAVDVHELRNRSQGGDLLDETGVVTLCRGCHQTVTENPVAAHEQGWTHWSCCLPIPCHPRSAPLPS